MWIELDDAIIDLFDLNTKATDKEARALNALFQSMYNNYHIVYGSRELLKEISHLPFIYEDNKMLITWILNHYISVYECRSIITKKIHIVPLEAIKPNNENEFYAIISDFEKIKSSQLLSENKTDYDLYYNIFNFLKMFGNNYCLYLENNTFNGGNVAAAVQIVENEKRFAICVVDSDKDYIKDSFGTTRTSANKEVQKAKRKGAVLDLYTLGMREKENLIPMDFYETITLDKKEFIMCVNKFATNIEFMKYIDLKGIKKKKIINADEQWRALYSDFIEECKRLNIYDDCSTENEYCIKGFGDKLIQITNEVFFENSYNRINDEQKEQVLTIKSDINSHIPSYIMEEWKSICKEMFNYGCSISEHFAQFHA